MNIEHNDGKHKPGKKLSKIKQKRNRRIERTKTNLQPI